mgnify:CR=1 FL=1
MTFGDIIPFVAVCAAAVTSLATIAGVRLANNSAERQLQMRLGHQDLKDQKEALRQRLEELYQLVDSWAGKVVIHHTTYRSVMAGRLTYNQALNITIESEGFEAARLFTLADLYFPRSHEILERIKALIDQMSGLQTAYKEEYRDVGPAANGDDYAQPLTKLLLEFNAAIDAYKSSLATYAREV